MLGAQAKIILIFNLFLASYVGATWSPVDGDMELSKNRMLISGQNTIDTNRHGVVTLVFKKKPRKNEHAALVFEMKDENTQDILLHMVHVGTDDDCCGTGTCKINLEDRSQTLVKIHQAQEQNPLNSQISYAEPTYYRHTSFIVPRDYMVAALEMVKEDRENKDRKVKFDFKGYTGYSCMTYVAKIFKSLKIDISLNGCIRKSGKNLRIRTSKYQSAGNIIVVRADKLPKYSEYNRNKMGERY